MRQKLAGEMKKLRRAVRTLREAREESLGLSALTGEAEQARKETEQAYKEAEKARKEAEQAGKEARNLQETLKEAAKESQTALGGVPQLHECLSQAQVRKTYTPSSVCLLPLCSFLFFLSIFCFCFRVLIVMDTYVF